jgi:REP element-mobilizing transposase RayT
MITMTTLDRVPLFGTCEKDTVTPSRDGWVMHDLWRDIPKAYPQIETSTFVIMPDHIHGIIHVKERMEQPVGVPLRAFKSLVTSALRKRHNKPDLIVWNPGYHDLCVWRPGSLAAFSHYIRDNPRRFCIKRANPDLFVRVNNLCHSRLPPAERWSGFGNFFLLDHPALIPLRVSRKATRDEREAIKQNVMREVIGGAVVVSPFISPGEKEVAEMVMDMDGGNVILLHAEGIGPYFKPHGRYFDACAKGRLLMLSGFPSTGRAVPLTRETCLTLNAWCAGIAGALPSECKQL